MTKPITLKNITLFFSRKNCFESFSATIHAGSSIAIVGKNGCGKSSLLKIIGRMMPPSSGTLIMPEPVKIGYVEQTICDYKDLSGGQRLNKRIYEELLKEPDLLLLDEPTNHLDKKNRKNLIRTLNQYKGTLVIVSHDTELIRVCTNILWHIDNGNINEFTGDYDDYVKESIKKVSMIESEIIRIKKEQKNVHYDLMKEQNRSAKSKEKGHKSIKQRKWPTIVSKTKAGRAGSTSGKKKAAIDARKQYLREKIDDIWLPNEPLPRFSINPKLNKDSNVITINNASVCYTIGEPILNNINISILGNERISVCGDNGSGKSSFLKSIMGAKEINKTGNWYIPRSNDIGYLDQHYSNLNDSITVIEQVMKLRGDLDETQASDFLNDFMFRSYEQINQKIRLLSGGEKARLSLCLIAVKPPKLLILDEITNNLDLETKEYVAKILQIYPGAMILVSHEDEFISKVGVDYIYKVKDKSIQLL